MNTIRFTALMAAVIFATASLAAGLSNDQFNTESKLPGLTDDEMALAVGESSCPGIVFNMVPRCQIPNLPNCFVQPACCQGPYEGNPCANVLGVNPTGDGPYVPIKQTCPKLPATLCDCVPGGCISAGAGQINCTQNQFEPIAPPC